MNAHGKAPYRPWFDGGGERRTRAKTEGPQAPSVPLRVSPGAATRTVVAVFGALAAMAGIEHGIGEIRQGGVAPDTPFIQFSITRSPSDESIGGRRTR